MTAPALWRRFQAFDRGELGSSVRELSLAGKTTRELHVMLLAKGFSARRVTIAGPCNAKGQPQWWLVDGGASPDARDPKCAVEDTYVHADGGVVHVFPHGQPWRAYQGVAPYAMKTVLLRPPAAAKDPTTGRAFLAADTSPRNWALRVTDAGRPIPRSLRSGHGLKYGPSDKERSFALAKEVARQAHIPLAPGPVRAAPFDAVGVSRWTFTMVPTLDFWRAVEMLPPTRERVHAQFAELVRDKMLTHYVFPGRGVSARVDEDAALALASFRVVMGQMVFQVDPDGYEGSVEQLLPFVKWVLDELGPCRVLEDGTGRDFSKQARRFPSQLLAPAIIPDDA
jgi:hypothetical protein